MEKIDVIRKREDIPAEDKWAIEDLYATDALWEEELNSLEADKDTLAGFAGKLADGGDVLCEYLLLMEKVNCKAERLAHYCMRKADEDTRVAEYQAMSGKFMSVIVALGAACSFETPEIMAISDEVLANFYAQCLALERYRRYLTDLRRMKEHVLTTAEEKLLAAAGEMSQAPDNIYSMFADADMTFPDAVDSEGNQHPVSQGTFVACEESPDRVLRKSAYESLYGSFAKFKNTAAGLLF